MKIEYLFEKGKIFTFSNFLSIIRIFLGIIIYRLIMAQDAGGAIILSIFAIITDYADGYFARKNNEISELGKILDPLGDKVTIALASVAIHQSYGLPLWVVFVIIGRDLLIVFGSLFLIQKVQRVVASEKPGKVAVTIISLLLLSYLFEFQIIQIPLLYLTLAAVLVSFFYYMKKFIRIFFQPAGSSRYIE